MMPMFIHNKDEDVHHRHDNDHSDDKSMTRQTYRTHTTVYLISSDLQGVVSDQTPIAFLSRVPPSPFVPPPRSTVKLCSP